MIGKKYDADVYYFYTYGSTGTTSFTITDYQKIEQFDTYYYVSAGNTGDKFTVYEEPSTGIREYTEWDDDIDTKYDSFYFIDADTLTFNSPDIDFDDNIKNVDISQYGIYHTGYINFKNVVSKYMIIANSPLFLNDAVVDVDHTEWIRSARQAMGFYDRGYQCYDPSDPW